MEETRKQSFIEFVALMAMMMSLTALSIDAILPALAEVGIELGELNNNNHQLIISALFIGLSIGQLFYGPISDATGRKNPLYVGLFIFIIGSLIAILSQQFEIMLLGRVVQGIGLAAPRTVCLAMIRDTYAGEKMAKVMSFIMMVFILVPILAPSLGQAILWWFSWRAIFIIILIIALTILAWFGTRMPETLQPEDRISLSPGDLFQSLKVVIKNRQAMVYTFASGLVSGAFIGFLNSSQQIFQVQYNLGERFPLIFAMLAFSLGCAAVVNGRVVERYGMKKMVRIAIAVITLLAVCCSLLLWQQQYEFALWQTILYLVMTLFSTGILFGNMNSLAMEPLGSVAGVGSALVGFLSTIIGAVLGSITGGNYDGTIFPMVMGFLIYGGLSWALMEFENRVDTE